MVCGRPSGGRPRQRHAAAVKRRAGRAVSRRRWRRHWVAVGSRGGAHRRRAAGTPQPMPGTLCDCQGGDQETVRQWGKNACEAPLGATGALPCNVLVCDACSCGLPRAIRRGVHPLKTPARASCSARTKFAGQIRLETLPRTSYTVQLEGAQRRFGKTSVPTLCPLQNSAGGSSLLLHSIQVRWPALRITTRLLQPLATCHRRRRRRERTRPPQRTQPARVEGDLLPWSSGRPCPDLIPISAGCRTATIIRVALSRARLGAAVPGRYGSCGPA